MEFEQAYWDANYHHPEQMDGIANATEHARYLKSYFEVENVGISSIIDIGVGLGVQFREMLLLFSPDRALGIDPSKYALNNARGLQLDPYNRIDVELRRQSLQEWCADDADPQTEFDLGICMSVFQYISSEELSEVLPVLAKRLKYLYLTVPTRIEFERQVEALEFHDSYAIRRSQRELLDLIQPHFTIISSRVLESNIHFDERNTELTDLLFRF